MTEDKSSTAIPFLSFPRDVDGTIPAILSDGGSLTYAELQKAASEIAAVLRSALRPHSPVCMSIPSGTEFVSCLLALVMARARISLAHHQLSATEIDAIARDGRAVAHISDHATRPGTIPPSRSVRLTSDTWLHLLQDDRDLAPTDPTDVALNLYTSGTDGRMKGVIRSGLSLVAEARAIASKLGYGCGTRVLCAVPLSHSYGLTMGLSGVLAAGATLVVASPGTPNLLRACIERHRPNVLIGVPAQYGLWSLCEPRELEPGLLRLCISSGAPLPEETSISFHKKWGRVLAQQYGMSECGAVTIDLDAQPGSPSVGTPYPGVAVRVDPAGAGQDGIGEIIVDGPYLASGYVGGLENDLPRNPFSERGFLTGDLGRIDASGRLNVIGRRTWQINVHGNKVDPAQVESTIGKCPGVLDVAVLGVGDPHGDQWIAAFVVATHSARPGDILRFCHANLAPQKRPRRLIRVDAIPRNAMGKVDANPLLAQLARHRANPASEHATYGW